MRYRKRHQIYFEDKGGNPMRRMSAYVTPCMLLVGLLLLQGCHSPISQSVVVSCGPGGQMPPPDGPGAPCSTTNVSVGDSAPSNAIVINNSGPTGESLPSGAKCQWTGGQNKICTNPGQPSCSLYPNRTCKTTWHKDTKRCACACL